MPAGVSTPAVVPQSLFAGPSSARLCLRKRAKAVLLASMHVTAVLGQLNQEAANSSGKETHHRERETQTVTQYFFKTEMSNIAPIRGARGPLLWVLSSDQFALDRLEPPRQRRPCCKAAAAFDKLDSVDTIDWNVFC